MRYYFKNIEYISQISKKIINRLNNLYNVDDINIKNIYVDINKDLPERKYNYSLNKVRDILSVSFGYKNFKEIQKVHKNNDFIFEGNSTCFYVENKSDKLYLNFDKENQLGFNSYKNKFINEFKKYFLSLGIKNDNAVILAFSLSELIYKEDVKIKENYTSVYNIMNITDKIDLDYFIRDFIESSEKFLKEYYFTFKYQFKIEKFLNFSYINIYINKKELFILDAKNDFLTKDNIIKINEDNYSWLDFEDMWLTRFYSFIDLYLNLIFKDNYIKKMRMSDILENTFDLKKLLNLIAEIDPEKKHSINEFIDFLPSNKIEIKTKQLEYICLALYNFIKPMSNFCTNKNLRHLELFFKDQENLKKFYAIDENNKIIKYFLENKPDINDWNLETYKELFILYVNICCNYKKNYKNESFYKLFYQFEKLKNKYL